MIKVGWILPGCDPLGPAILVGSFPLAPVTVAARGAARGRPRAYGARGARPGADARGHGVRDDAAHLKPRTPREPGAGGPDSGRLCAQASRIVDSAVSMRPSLEEQYNNSVTLKANQH